MENQRIELYKEREFGEVFNATFAFIKQEFKPLGRAILVFILPFVLLQGIIMAVFQTSVFGIFKNPQLIAQDFGGFISTFLSSYLLLLIVIIVTQTMMYATLGAYLKLYSKSENEITISDLANEIKSCFLPVLGATLLFLLVVGVGLVLCLLPGIYLGVSLSLFLIAVVIEKKGVGDAFSRSFQLTHMQWWWTFLLLFVTLILVYIVSIILQIPAMVMGFTTMFHSIQNNTNPLEAFGPVYIVYTSVVSAIQQLLYLVPILLIAFQYFNLVEIREKTSLNQKINAIGQNE